MIKKEMRRKQIPLFATQHDLSELVKSVSLNRPIGLVVAGQIDQQILKILNDIENIHPFATYLVFDKGTNILSRAVPQRGGGQSYFIDQMENPQTIVLRCGGLLNENRFVAGQIGTTSVDRKSDEIYTLFSKEIRRKFEKIKSYYLGPEAVRLLDKGIRLTPTAKSSETYDLGR